MKYSYNLPGMTEDETALAELLKVMARLRNPNGGCPWDLEQTFKTIAPCTIEEAYEVADAIEQDNMDLLREELGDLLLQVVFHSQMAKEAGHFTFAEVAQGIASKLVSRHPHVFGDTDAKTAEKVLQNWEAIKAQERDRKAAKDGAEASALDGVAIGLPALTRAEKLQKRAARVGFEWNTIDGVLEKFIEEIGEIKAEINKTPRNKELLADEIGDLLFVVANLARWLKIDPEEALRRTNAKFDRRFREVEHRLAQKGKKPEQSNLNEMDGLWNDIKAEEKRKKAG